LGETSIGRAERRANADIAETNDVGALARRDSGEEAGILFDPPTTRVVAEILEHRSRRVIERTAPLAQRHKNSRVAEANDVGLAIAGNVCDEARMLVDSPTGIIAEIGNGERRLLECAVAPAQRDPYAGVPESDDVEYACPREVGQESRMLVDPPAAGIIAEILHDALRRPEPAVAVAERDPNAIVKEADDVGDAVAAEIDDITYMAIHSPSLVVAEVREDGSRRVGEGPVAVAERDEDAGIPEADDVLAASIAKVGEEARMPVDAPSGIVAEIRDGELRLAESTVASGEGDIDAGIAEPDDVFAGIAE
jgi:hypothetical protein